ncbi:unnamed protein product [Caretta caretta]
MAFQKSPDPSSATRKNPSLLEIGALCLDSDIIFGFTSHLLRRKGKIAEGSSGREPAPLSLELAPRKRLPPAADEDRCGSRPAPEGAGAVSLAELGHFERTGKGGWCKNCQVKLAELKKQAVKLAASSSPANSLPDPRLSALIFDKLQVPDYLQKNRNEGESRCEICATHLNQLKQEAIQMIHTLNQASYQEVPGLPQSSGALTGVLPRMVTVSSQRDLPLVSGQVGRQSGKSTNLFSGTERKKGLGWPQGTSSFPNSSVQVTVAPSGLSGALSSVTIQAQQYLEGMWSISRVNSFLPQACLAETATEGGWEGPNVHVASGLNNCDQTGTGGSLTSQSLVAPAGASAGTSAAASFFIRAAQKLNLSSKRKKCHPPLPRSHDFSVYATNFSGILQLCSPPAPPCLLRAVSKIKDNPGIGKT